MAFAHPRDSFGHSMLHQTLLPSCVLPFQRSPPLHRAPSPPSRSSSQVEKEAAMELSSLRKNLRPESLWAQHQQQSLFSAEHVAWAAESGNFLAEEFSVDDLLDFGELVETEGKGGCEGEEGEEEIEDARYFKADGNFNNHSSPTSALSFEPPPPTEIAVPADDEAELAWLSRFVDDSYTEFPPYLGVPPAPKPSTQLEPKSENRLGHTLGNPVPYLENTASAPSTESLLVPVKAKRSKRPRGAGSSWSTGVSSSWTTRGSAPFVDLSSSSSSTITTSPTSSSCSSSSSSPACLVYDYYAGLTSTDHFLLEGNPLPPPKKQKQKKRGRKPKQPGLAGAAATGGRGSGTAGVGGERRCSHCGVQKTPQWRAGPMGAKTLCNACGVRYKSGRLLPEYRPACSPTFVSHVHSNSHRKVLEMRRKKEEQQRLLAAACTAPVPS